MVEAGTGHIRVKKLYKGKPTSKQPTIGFVLTRDEAAKLSVFLNSAITRIEPRSSKTQSVVVTLYEKQQNDDGYYTSVSISKKLKR